MSKIRESARGEECTLRIPGVCNRNLETVVLCHAPYPGKFGSRKDNWWSAYGCSDCHDYVDGRGGSVNLQDEFWHNVARGRGSRVGVEDYWLPAIHETQAKLIEKGLLQWPAQKK